MSNPWEMTPQQRHYAANMLASVARDIMADESKRSPVVDSFCTTILACHTWGEVEQGATLALMGVIYRKGGEEGRDRVLQAMAQIAADYEAPGDRGPRFSTN